MNWLSFLQVMILEEKAAQEKYQVAVDAADDPKIRALFERLRDEEAFHARILESEYVRLEKLPGR